MAVDGKKNSSLPSKPTAVHVTNDNGNIAKVALSNAPSHRLQSLPNQDHMAENYDDLATTFHPRLFTALELYLHPNLIHAPREVKHEYMQGVLLRYTTNAEDRNRYTEFCNPERGGGAACCPPTCYLDEEKQKEYREKIMSSYKPLYKEPYVLDPSAFFVDSFLKAMNSDTHLKDRAIRSIMVEHAPGVYGFSMLHPCFCDILIREVENIEKWLRETGFKIMRPTTLNNFGVALKDFGMTDTLDKLLKKYIHHISRIFFPDVGGCSLDSHHGYVLEYGMNRDVKMDMHVDESEVTLNVCLGKVFTGGDLFFTGERCAKHVNSDPYHEEVISFPQGRPGTAIIHRGRHRHGALPTTSGHRINLVMWCRSSAFKEVEKHNKGFSKFCGECNRGGRKATSVKGKGKVA